MKLPSIACLDVFEPSVQNEIRLVAQPRFEINFSETYDRSEQLRLAKDADFILTGTAAVDAEMISLSGRVRLIQKWGIGVDKIDLEAARAAGVPVAITAGANAGPVSELAISLMLAVSRRIVYADRKTREGQWPKPEMRSTCYQLDGKTVGLLGFGAIARRTARRLAGFDAEIVYFDPTPADAATERTLNARSVSFEELIEKSDILSIHVPLTSRTRNLIDAAVLKKMKRNAVLINTARGGIVDEQALYNALCSGSLRGAGIDAFETEPAPSDNKLFSLDNVVVTPHAGGGVFDNVANVARHAIGNMAKVLDGTELNSVDVIVPGKGK